MMMARSDCGLFALSLARRFHENRLIGSPRGSSVGAGPHEQTLISDRQRPEFATFRGIEPPLNRANGFRPRYRNMQDWVLVREFMNGAFHAGDDDCGRAWSCQNLFRADDVWAGQFLPVRLHDSGRRVTGIARSDIPKARAPHLETWGLLWRDDSCPKTCSLTPTHTGLHQAGTFGP